MGGQKGGSKGGVQKGGSKGGGLKGGTLKGTFWGYKRGCLIGVYGRNRGVGRGACVYVRCKCVFWGV